MGVQRQGLVAARTAGGGSIPDRSGVIAGAALKAVRESLAVSQERLAELVGVDPNTVQSWESGRRPLTSTRVSTLAALRRELVRLGASWAAVATLDPAIEADHILGHVLAADPDAVSLLLPWTSAVLPRDVTECLGWPFTGVAPAALGHPGWAPMVSADERRAFFARLRLGVDQARRIYRGPGAAQPHRQIYYLLSWARDEPTRTWLADVERVERRAWRPGDGWTPRWVTARSIAITRARHGDPEPLAQFTAAGLVTQDCQAADLAYWSYWVGDLDHVLWRADADMTGPDAQRWRGERLLRHITDRLTPGEPLTDLYAASARALLESRPALLHVPGRALAIRGRIETVLDVDRLSPGSRRAFEDIRLMTKLTHP